MATVVEMGILTESRGFPQVKIADRKDAQDFVRILHNSGVSVNLREVADDSTGPSNDRPID